MRATQVNGTYVGSFDALGTSLSAAPCWILELEGPNGVLAEKKICGEQVTVARLTYKVNSDVPAGTYEAGFIMDVGPPGEPAVVAQVDIPAS